MKSTPKSPAFQFYPDKWLVDTRRLSYETKGVFIDFMSQVWIQNQEVCSVPNDDDFIAGEIGCPIDVWQRAKAELLNPNRPILVVTETNRLFVNGLYKEAMKQGERRDRLRRNGMLGGRPKNQLVSAGKQENQKVIFEKPKKSFLSPSPTLVTPPTPSDLESARFATLKRLEAKLNSIYKRGATEAWSYAEQTALAEVCRRDKPEDELEHIMRWRRAMPADDRKRFFPQSIHSLLSRWTEHLDKARVQCPEPAQKQQQQKPTATPTAIPFDRRAQLWDKAKKETGIRL